MNDRLVTESPAVEGQASFPINMRRAKMSRGLRLTQSARLVGWWEGVRSEGLSAGAQALDTNDLTRGARAAKRFAGIGC